MDVLHQSRSTTGVVVTKIHDGGLLGSVSHKLIGIGYPSESAIIMNHAEARQLRDWLIANVPEKPDACFWLGDRG